jgi:hypothetical protein
MAGGRLEQGCDLSSTDGCSRVCGKLQNFNDCQKIRVATQGLLETTSMDEASEVTNMQEQGRGV